VELAVNIGVVATPVAVAVIVTDVVPPANVPLAPVSGAENVTIAPPMGELPIITVPTSGEAKAVLMAALCGDPLVGAITSTGLLTPVLPQPGKKSNVRRRRSKLLAATSLVNASLLAGISAMDFMSLSRS
jgi:hypothetical protein